MAVVRNSTMDALLEEINLQLRLLPDRLRTLSQERESSSRPQSIVDVDYADAHHSYGEILRDLVKNLQCEYVLM